MTWQVYAAVPRVMQMRQIIQEQCPDQANKAVFDKELHATLVMSK